MGLGLHKRGSIWWISYQGQDGKQHRESSGSRSRATAEKFLTKRRNEVLEVRLGLPRSQVPRLTDWAKEFLEDVPHANTKNRYASSIKHLVGFFGEARLTEITPEGIYRFQRKRLSDGVRHATVNRDVSVLSGMLRKAKKLRFIPSNPCQDVDILKEAHERREALPFSNEEEERLLRVCEPLLKIFVVVLLETGLRPKKEALSLEWANVDLEGSEPAIHVTKSKTRAGIRRVLLTDFCAASLRQWRNLLGENYSPYVFPAPLNPKRSWTVYQDAWERAVNAAGLQGRRVYDLRSTFATRAMEQYPHNIAVARLLGHQTPVILGRYAKSPDASAPMIVSRLNQSRATRTRSTIQ